MFPFFESWICWYIQSIEHNQVSKYFWIINRYRWAISSLYIVLFLSSSMYRIQQCMSLHLLLLLILFFTFTESILENVNDVVCLLFLSNEGDTDIFYDNDNDTIKTLISFAAMEDKTIVDQKIIIISNIKSQIIFPKHFVVGSHEYKLRYCSCTYNEHNGSFNGNIFSRHGESFQSGGMKIVLIKSPFNRIHTHNWYMK